MVGWQGTKKSDSLSRLALSSHVNPSSKVKENESNFFSFQNFNYSCDRRSFQRVVSSARPNNIIKVIIHSAQLCISFHNFHQNWKGRSGSVRITIFFLFVGVRVFTNHLTLLKTTTQLVYASDSITLLQAVVMMSLEKSFAFLCEELKSQS